MVYTTKMLLEKYADYANPHEKIKRECENGKLVKIIRGLYEDNSLTSGYLLSGYITGPSYLSFEYVLSLNGIIPEYVPNVTCASFKKGKTKAYDTPFGRFVYHDIPPAVFYMGTVSCDEQGYSYLIATPEKAICDELYSVRQVRSMREFLKLLEDDLRIDIDELFKLDKDRIKEYAEGYRRKNLSLLIKFLEGGN